MDQILALIRQFIDLFRWWIIVAPWDQAVRVRAGKHVAVLDKGIHLRIPLIDSLYLQSTRMRVTCIGRQTLTSLDGKTITVTSSVGYVIVNTLLLHNTLYHAEDTIRQIVSGAVADVVSSVEAKDLTPKLVSSSINKLIGFEKYGLGEVNVFITELTQSRTYRLIGDYAQVYSTGTFLSTERDNTVPVK